MKKITESTARSTEQYSISPVAAGEKATPQSVEQEEQDPSQAEVRVKLPKKALGILEKAGRDLEIEGIEDFWRGNGYYFDR